MMNCQTPPGLRSNARIVVENPLGPHHSTKCFGSVHASKTSSRGASKTRSKTSSRSDGVENVELELLLGSMPLLPCLQPLQVHLEAVEALVPKPAVAHQPFIDVLERGGTDPAGARLRLAATYDQACPFEDFQVLR